MPFAPVLRASEGPNDPARAALLAAYHADEDAVVDDLLTDLRLTPEQRDRIQARARRLATALREEATSHGGVEAFMHVYALDTHEGVMLMCLAEALLRVPDAETADRLIRDKLGDTDWQRRLGDSESFLVNASTFGLMLTGQVLKLELGGDGLAKRLGRLVARLGEPVVREAIKQSMRILGRQFVLGQTIEQAIERARAAEKQGFAYSYDMLGEGARTRADAARYLDAYLDALERVAGSSRSTELMLRPSLSIKLSALHPRYEFSQSRRLREELLPTLRRLFARARELDTPVTIDAEESDRLLPSLDLLEALGADPALEGWDGLGLAVQAYQKRAIHVIAWLADLARRTRRRLPVRLVKGAYWDGEIKRAQQQGHADYTVFTRKIATDVSYLACARAMLSEPTLFYPQFATHNAQTLASILELAGDRWGFEFQKLHGMGDALYGDLARRENLAVPCRVYAPVGSHKDLLPYLVRRLLENGANSSFVHQVVDPARSIEDLIADPAQRLRALHPRRHPAIPRPADLYRPARANSPGVDLSDPLALGALRAAIGRATSRSFRAKPGVAGALSAVHTVCDPADRRRRVGEVELADATAARTALGLAAQGFPAWQALPAAERAAILERAADLMIAESGPLIGLCVREAGKTLADAVADWREAIDFLRYYAAEARRLFAQPITLPGPTGESNHLALHGRGVFVAISPWNFPIAIFTGQVAAALAAGNAVIAKPAEATSLLGQAIVDLLHRAGVPEDALVHLPGEGRVVGPVLVTDPRCAGVVFTGSTATGFTINRAMAATDLPIRPLIAETGGLNAMLVDSSALPEAVVGDAIESAFRSAGQRCSALRLLLVQDDIADRVIEMLAGAMDELVVGDPGELATDIGPVIDARAKAKLDAHVERMAREQRLVRRLELGDAHAHGSFVAPALLELDRIDRLREEVFGPILHVVRWRAAELDAVIDAVNGSGYGLTFGIHSRIDTTVEHAASRIRAGNIYVNRNIIGAVVGTQPFGGEGLSGTGFKAGGPHYLLRFATERTLTVNTAAVGGNLQLLGSLAEPS